MFNLKQVLLSAVTVAGTTCATFAVGIPVRAATITDSVNADKSPAAGTTWSANEVGWSYTPSFSYTLSGINTKFGAGWNSLSRNVTVEVYDKTPIAGGTLLRSANFTSLVNTFSGGTFAALDLLAGEDYFIGFRNVSGLGVNFTENPGAIALSSFEYSFSNNGSYPYSHNFEPHTQAILQFVGETPTAVPTPALLPGLVGLGMAALRKRKENQKQEAAETVQS